MEGGCEGFGALLFGLYGIMIGVVILEIFKILAIIWACLLGVGIIVGLVYFLWRYCRSKDHEETPVVPISIVETC